MSKSYYHMRSWWVLSLLLAAPLLAAGEEPKIVCYYSNWAVYRPGLAKFTPENINPYLCTHLIYAFGGINSKYEIKVFDRYSDLDQGNYQKFVGLKSYNPKLKTLLAVGGWNEGSKRFSKMVESRSNRMHFVRSAVRFLREHGFDGLDLDWEYPAFRDGSNPGDKQGYAQLVRELREAFDSERTGSGKSKLLLTIAVPAGKEYIDKGFDIPTISKNVDFMNCLTYDYHTAFEAETHHHAPLYALPDETGTDAALNVDWTIQYYLQLGVPREKLILGIPTYGRSYTLQDPADNEMDALVEGPGEEGAATREKGYLAYYEICQNVLEKGWEVQAPHPRQAGPYAFKDNQWVGFDDEEMIVEKAQYILDQGLGGAMVWTLDNDDFRGGCGGEKSPLVSALRVALLSNTIAGSSSRRSEARSNERFVTVRFDDDDDEEEPSTPAPRRSSLRRGNKRVNRLSTPAPPTTPDPGPTFECTDEGFFNNPRDCRKYFWCLDSGPANLGIVPHAFTCPSGLFFNSNMEACDYPENVVCRNKPTAEAATTTTTAKPRLTRPRFRYSTTTTTTTTTTEEPEDEDLNSLADIPEAKPGVNQNVAELLRLIQSIGGVERLQTILGSRGEAEPAATHKGIPDYVAPQRHAVSSTVAPPPQPPAQESIRQAFSPRPYRPATLDDDDRAIGSQVPHRPQYESQGDSQLFQYVEPDRTRSSQAGFPFVYQTPDRAVRDPVTPVEEVTTTTEAAPSLNTYRTPVRVQAGKVVRVQQQNENGGRRRTRIRVRPISANRTSSFGNRGRVLEDALDRPEELTGRSAVREPIVAVRRLPPGEVPLELIFTTTEEAPTTQLSNRRFRPGYQPPLAVGSDFEEDDSEDYFAETTRHTVPTTTTSTTTTTTTTRRPARRTKPPPRPTTTTTTRAPRRISATAAPAVEVSEPVLLKDNQVECYKRGIYAHPDDCSRFVVCGPNGRTGQALRGRILNCPASQVFFEDIGRCSRGDRATCQRRRRK